jgi:aconitase B
MLEAYRQHVAERGALGIPPLPLTKQQTEELVALLKNPPASMMRPRSRPNSWPRWPRARKPAR